jgi:hypothetical protein
LVSLGSLPKGKFRLINQCDVSYQRVRRRGRYELDARRKLIGYTGPLTTTARSGLHDVCHITQGSSLRAALV